MIPQEKLQLPNGAEIPVYRLNTVILGAGTTGLVALKLGRDFIGIELNHEYCEMAERRIFGALQFRPNPQ